MEKTPRYQLSQWEKTDRILMEDFNADNANLEAALASLAAGQTAETTRVNTELAQKADITTLNSVKSALQTEDARLNSVKLQLVDLGRLTITPTGTSRSADVSFNGTLLGQCVAAFVDVTAPSGASQVGVTFNQGGSIAFQSTGVYLSGFMRLYSGNKGRMIFFPLGDPDSIIGCLSVAPNISIGYSSMTFRQVTKIGLYANGSGSPTLPAAPFQFHFRGLKAC